MNAENKELFELYSMTWRCILERSFYWQESDIKDFVDYWLKYIGMSDKKASWIFHYTPTSHVALHIARHYYPNTNGLEIVTIQKSIEEIIDYEIGAKSTAYPCVPTQEYLEKTNWNLIRVRIGQLFDTINKKHATEGNS
jgi:hypothetical protein